LEFFIFLDRTGPTHTRSDRTGKTLSTVHFAERWRAAQMKAKRKGKSSAGEQRKGRGAQGKGKSSVGE